jgi:hypothetical protein
MANTHKGNKNRKYGRNKVSSARYVAEDRKVKNKAIKRARHLKNHPND